MINQADLKQRLHYDPSTGIFIWKELPQSYPRANNRNAIFAGKQAGAKRKNGYSYIQIDKKLYLTHRLAWLYQTSKWPSAFIDHIDGCPSNNRFANLRQADIYQNSQNHKIFCTNTSGVTGVSYAGKFKLWIAYINIKGKRKPLGEYKYKQDAVDARKKAEEEYYNGRTRI
jgi:hypothetical protein